MGDYDFEEASYWFDVTHLAHWIVSKGYDPVMTDVAMVVECLLDNIEAQESKQ
jgi:hypothetical protein